MDDAAWTLSELVEQASAALERVPAPDNGQVRAVPDERNLRYYTTLGLLDRPAAMRGRTALYGRRHLAQVVAIKRLQTAGKSLAEIQAILATIDNATLSRMSGVVLPAGGAKKPARAAFWRATPATPAPTPVPVPVSVPVPVPPTPPLPAATTTLIRISLASGVDLLVDPALAAAAAIDIPALAAAARTLIADHAPTMEDS